MHSMRFGQEDPEDRNQRDQAIERCALQKAIKECYILSDSQTALKQLKANTFDSEVVWQFRNTIKQIKTRQLVSLSMMDITTMTGIQKGTARWHKSGKADSVSFRLCGTDDKTAVHISVQYYCATDMLLLELKIRFKISAISLLYRFLTFSGKTSSHRKSKSRVTTNRSQCRKANSSSQSISPYFTIQSSLQN